MPPAGAPGEAGGDVQEPVAQCFGLARFEGVGQGDQAQPGGRSAAIMTAAARRC